MSEYVQERFIDWLRKNGRRIDDVHRPDMYNARYNPDRHRIGEVRLPLPTGHFDVAVLFSVFTHMLIDDIETSLRALKRSLTRGGRALVTVYVQDGVPVQTENPVDWPSEYTGPLHRVLLERTAFEKHVPAAGLEKIRDFQAKGERHPQYVVGQPTYRLARP